MSSNPSQDQTTVQRLAALEAQLDQTLTSNRQKAMVLRIVTALAVGLLGCYFYYAHQQISRFDTDAAADVLQARLQEALPQASREIRASLVAKAPQVVAEAQVRLLELPHQVLNVHFKSRLQHHLAEQIRLVEEEFYQTVKAQIDAIQATHLANRVNPLSEAETADLLDQVMAIYGQQASVVLDKVYNDYANQADELIGYLHKLANNQGLSRREQIHRDLLQTFLLLMEKHQGEGSLQWDRVFTNPMEAYVPIQ